MLIEWWERFRGYDKWVETEATVETTRVKTEHGRYGDHETSRDVLRFIDQQGETQRLSFTVPGDSSLFQLVDGSKVNIRYNPSNPDEYYLRELLQTRIRSSARAILIIVIALILIFSGWFRSTVHH